MVFIRCYIPPINIAQLGSEILVQADDVYRYTKDLYEKGREHKSFLPVGEIEVMEFFNWKAKTSNLGIVKRKLIQFLMK